jgi:hypothetical protein
MTVVSYHTTSGSLPQLLHICSNQVLQSFQDLL